MNYIAQKREKIFKWSHWQYFSLKILIQKPLLNKKKKILYKNHMSVSLMLNSNCRKVFTTIILILGSLQLKILIKMR